MHLDPIMLNVVGATLVILFTGWMVRILNQPHVMGYLLAGVIIGPFGLGLLHDQALLARLGEFGVVLLLFFAGMEISPRQLASRWRIAFLGTLIQICASVGVIWLIGQALDWPTSRIILLGFVVSLSSTAVVINYLREIREIDTKIGQDVLAVLLAQDVAMIPMLIILGILGGGAVDSNTLTLQTIGAVLILGLMAWVSIYTRIRLPLGRLIRQDHELQIFTAFSMCLGLALITGLFGLSTALGAFVAGMLVGAARETGWVHKRLEPFRVVFVAVFFVSIGLLVDIAFLVEHFMIVITLLVAVFITNACINATIFRILGDSLRNSIYAGVILAQIGEFSFVLAAVGYQSKLISEYGYQVSVAVIALSLLLSPTLISITRRVQRRLRPAQ
jgi:CPA2 family monovalent cation:H+ antiporter-2